MKDTGTGLSTERTEELLDKARAGHDAVLIEKGELERLRADAERYRWLRYYAEHQDEMDALGLPDVVTGDELDTIIDSQIDAARKARP